MKKRTLRFPTAGRRLAALGMAAALLAGCGLFSVTEHDTFTVEVSSSSQTTVELITGNLFSIFFDETGNQVYHLFEGDTANVNLPFRRDYDLRETGMFYARAASSDDPEATITMRVLIDGREQFNVTTVLEGVGIEYSYVAH